jgi:hypothetical protein
VYVQRSRPPVASIKLNDDYEAVLPSVSLGLATTTSEPMTARPLVHLSVLLLLLKKVS